MEDIALQWQPWQIILIIGVYILVVLAIGFYAHTKRIEDTDQDFFATKWSTGWIGISVSMAVTFASAGYVMGTIGAFYGSPPALTGYLFGAMLAPLVLWWIARRLWPIGRRDGYITYTDFLGDFYKSEPLRVIVSILIVVFFVPYFAVNLVAPGLLLELLSGGAIPYNAGVISMAVVGTAYVLVGGIRGVIWTDILQCAVIYIMFLVLIPIVVAAAGGVGEVISSVPDEQFSYSFDLNMWMLVISWMVMIALIQPGNPDRAFRLLAAKSLKSIRIGIIASVFLLGLWSVIGMVLGWTFNVLSLPEFEDTDLLVPIGIAEYAVWLMPFFLVALWAGGMSTLDSGMISCSSMVTKDVYRRNINPQAPQRKVTFLSRVLVLVFGVLATFIALAEVEFLWLFIGAAAGVSMQWLPSLLFGLYWKRANTSAAWAALLSGIGVTVFFQYAVESPWPGPAGPAILGFAVQIPLYIVVALATRPMSEAHLDHYQGIFKRASKEKTPRAD